ncbi:MAG TPA: type II secretion system F family protein [Gammaproteobacteria bacterium]
MANFRYKGRSPRGDLVTGQLEADSADGVATQLFNTGITPVEITPVPQKQETLSDFWRRLGGGKPTYTDLIMFTRQMYTLVKAGVPMIRALNGLTHSTRNPVLASALRDITESLESGRDLAGSMARHPDIFSPLFINVVRVGENSGALEDAFMRMYQYLGLEKDIRDRVKRAFRYPIIVVTFISIAIAIITMFVIPRFADFFRHAHLKLPLPTRVILAVSDFAVHNWFWVLAALVLAGFAFNNYVRTEQGRYKWDHFKLRMPIVGAIVMRATLARFARGFGLAYRAGVPLVQSLTLVARAVGNEYMGERILQMRHGVERGESLTRTAATTGVFTPVVMQMLGVGEETGMVADMLDEVAEFYEREVDYDLQNLSTNIEPILLVIMGFMVLILALGVFLPMWDLAANANKI